MIVHMSLGAFCCLLHGLKRMDTNMIEVSIKVTCDKCLNHKSIDFDYDDSIDLVRIDRIARDKLIIHGWIV